MIWSQSYDPLGAPWLSTLVAAVPLFVLLGGLALLRWRAPVAALAGLVAALLAPVHAAMLRSYSTRQAVAHTFGS